MAGHHELDPMPPTHPILSDAEYKARMAEMDTDRRAGIVIMKGVINTLGERKIIKKKPIIRVGWDLHIFFETGSPHRLIHFQLHTLRENITSVNVTLREIDSKDLDEIRKLTSIGNEHPKNTRVILNRAPVPFSQVALVGVLEQVFMPQPKLSSKKVILSQFDGTLTDLIAQRSKSSR